MLRHVTVHPVGMGGNGGAVMLSFEYAPGDDTRPKAQGVSHCLGLVFHMGLV